MQAFYSLIYNRIKKIKSLERALSIKRQKKENVKKSNKISKILKKIKQKTTKSSKFELHFVKVSEFLEWNDVHYAKQSCGLSTTEC